MTFWSEKLAETRQPAQPLRPPQIPQQPAAAEDRYAGYLQQAADAMELPEPAASVAERFGQTPGQDVFVARQGQRSVAYVDDPEDANRQRQIKAYAEKLATQAGEFSGTAKAAHDRAALVQQLVQAGEFTSNVDNTPRRAATTRGVSGYTAGNLGVR
jgi:hypothetical protein